MGILSKPEDFWWHALENSLYVNLKEVVRNIAYERPKSFTATEPKEKFVSRLLNFYLDLD